MIRSTAGLLQWYAADQETGLSDTTRVTSMVDRAGNSNTLTGATGPQWRDATNGISGIPAYEFGANNEVSGSGRIMPLAEFTIFIVMTYTSGRPIGVENDGNGNNGLALFNNNSWVVRNSGSNWDINTDAASPTVHSVRIGTGGGDALSTAGGGRNTSTVSYTDAGVNFTLGSSGNGGSDFTGKIAEFLSYSRKLTDDEWYGLYAYLRTKYAF